MSVPPTKTSTAPVADNEVELQAQPIDLAHKSTSSSSSTSSNPPASARVIGDASKPIFLVNSVLVLSNVKPGDNCGMPFLLRLSPQEAQDLLLLEQA